MLKISDTSSSDRVTFSTMTVTVTSVTGDLKQADRGQNKSHSITQHVNKLHHGDHKVKCLR